MIVKLDNALDKYSIVIDRGEVTIGSCWSGGDLVSQSEFYTIFNALEVESYKPTEFYPIGGGGIAGVIDSHTYISVHDEPSKIKIVSNDRIYLSDKLNSYVGRDTYNEKMGIFLENVKFLSECNIFLGKDDFVMRETRDRVEYVPYIGDSRFTKDTTSCNPWDFVDKIQNTCIGGDIEYSNLKAYGENWTFKLNLLNDTFRWDRHDFQKVDCRNNPNEVGQYLERYKRFL